MDNTSNGLGGLQSESMSIGPEVLGRRRLDSKKKLGP